MRIVVVANFTISSKVLVEQSIRNILVYFLCNTEANDESVSVEIIQRVTMDILKVHKLVVVHRMQEVDSFHIYHQVTVDRNFYVDLNFREVF